MNNARGQACRLPINGLDQRAFCKACLIHDAVGVHHLARAVIQGETAGHIAHGPHRHGLVKPEALAVEKHQFDIAAVIFAHNPIGQSAPTSGERGMAQDTQIKGGQRIGFGVCQ